MVPLLEQATRNQWFVNVVILSHSCVGSYLFDCLALKTQATSAKLLHLQCGYVELRC